MSTLATGDSCVSSNRFSERKESYELLVAGFMILTDNDNITLLSLSILRGIVPTINADEISSVRVVRKRNLENSSPTSQYTSLIVRLTAIERAKYILRSRKERNYFSTTEIDKSILNEELLSRLPISKILINDVLTSSEYRNYTSLKNMTKNLGFPYVWHNDGKFLVRWKKNEKAFYFTTVTDLNIIRNIYLDTEHHVTRTRPNVLSQTYYRNVTDATHDNKNSSNTQAQHHK